MIEDQSLVIMPEYGPMYVGSVGTVLRVKGCKGWSCDHTSDGGCLHEEICSWMIGNVILIER